MKPYVKRQKNDAADTEAICEAVTRPNMRFVPIKSEEQQSVLVLHRSHDMLMLLNPFRARFAVFGIIAAQGQRRVIELSAQLRDRERLDVAQIARVAVLALAAQLDDLATAIRGIEQQLMAWHRQSQPAGDWRRSRGSASAPPRRSPPVCPIRLSSGRAGRLRPGSAFVPRQAFSGGKDRLGQISMMGNGYLRRLLVVGATSVTRRVGTNDTGARLWVRSPLARKPPRVVTVAIANKTAHTAWAISVRRKDYRADAIA